MNFLIDLAHQPLFRLLGALIVLLATDMKPLYGVGAGLVWLIWVFLGFRMQDGRRIFF
jgi:hypothetical protein